MQDWLDQGWTEIDIRHRHALCNVERNGKGKIARTNRGKGTKAPNLQKRSSKRVVINDLREYQ
eukprot:9494739-Pyramimonas_sp.AAC.1